MAVLRIKEQWPKRSGSARVNSERLYRRYFKVLTDTDWDGPGVIEDTFARYNRSGQDFANDDGTVLRDVPWMGSPYDNKGSKPAPDPAPVPPEEDGQDPDEPEVSEEGDSAAVCVDFDVNQHDADSRWWDLMLLYTNRPEKNPDEYGADPTQRETEVQWGSQVFTWALQVDWSSPPRLIANSAGDPFNPPAQTEYSYRVLTLTRWEKTGPGGWDPVASGNLENTVNSEPWLGFETGTVKLKSITAQRLWECGAYYWRVTYTFHIRWYQPWDYRPLDAGFRFKDGSNMALFTPAPGVPPGTPGLLDGQGGKLNGNGVPSGAHPAVRWDGTVVNGVALSPYQLHPQRDFNTAIVPKLLIPG